MSFMKNKKLIIGIVIVVVLALIIVSNMTKKGGSSKTVQTEKVKRERIVATVSGSAKIQPEVQVKISAEVSGKIVKLGVKEGDYVHAGDFLAQLNPEAYQAAVEQSKSNLDYAKAGYEKAKSEYERARKLIKKDGIAESELEIAKASYEQAKAQVEQSSAALKQAKENLSKTTLYSPMDGTISQLNKKVGEMAMGSQFTLDVIMIVADLSSMQAEIEIDENDIISVTLNDTARIMVDAYPDTVFKGIVTEISNSGVTAGAGTQEEVTNFLVKTRMLQKPERLRPGMSATVDVVTDSRDSALVIPIQCVTLRAPVSEDKDDADKKSETETNSKEKERVVFIVKDDVAHQVRVKTGISSDTHWEILSGVAEDDVVVSGSYRVISKELKDGQKVEIDNQAKKFIAE